MTDDLREQAKDAKAFMPWAGRLLEDAADKIDRLESENARLRQALQIIAYDEHPVTGALQDTAWRALEALKGPTP